MPKEEAQTRQGHDASRDAECGAAAAAGSRPKHSYVWRRGAHAGICDVRDSPGHKKAALEMRWIQPDITKRTPSLSLVQTESLLRTCSGCGDAGNQSPLLPLNPLRLRLLAVKFSLREIGKIFSIEIRNFKPWKMPKLLKFQVFRGVVFFNCD